MLFEYWAMDKIGQGLRSLVQDRGSSVASYDQTSSALPSTQPRVVVRVSPGINRHTVTLWTCSKVCVISFVAGIIVGYTLKQRFRRWAARMLKRLKDD